MSRALPIRKCAASSPSASGLSTRHLVHFGSVAICFNEEALRYGTSL